MTTAFAVLLLCVGSAALIIAVATFFWVNRTPSTSERFDEHGRVPLFSVALRAANDEAAAGVTSEVSNDAHVAGAPVALVDREPANRASMSAANRPAGGTQTTGVPRGTDMEVPGGNAAGGPSANGSAPSTSKLRREGEASWASAPGWPTPSNSTPIRAPEHSYGPPEVLLSFSAQQPGYIPPPLSYENIVSSHDVPGSMIEGHNLRFSVPVEGTLQFLPGRLEISSGLDAGREIRFVNVPGPNGTEVTFGRNEGPLYRHIQLRDQTVSREHARMTLAEGQWQLANLSRTNPVAHNGRVLGYGEQQPLEDGDRVEMGEVVFSFRSR